MAAQIGLAWDPDSAADLAGYKIYYGTSPRTGLDPKTCGLCGYTIFIPLGNATTYTLNNLVSGQTYYFSVTACDTSQNESGFSNQVSGAATGPIPAQYNLTVNVNGSGSVTKNPDKTSYSTGDQLTLTATAGSGYSFSNWSGDASGTANPVTLTMNGNKTVTADFSAAAANLVVTSITGLSASGPAGGPFSPSGQSYTIENKGGVALTWSASKTQGWVSLTSSRGNLAPGASATVTVSINGNGNTLSAGSYSDTIAFNNLTDGNGSTTRSVALTVGSANQGYTLTADPPGLVVVVDGLNYRAPQTFNWTPGSSHTVSVLSPQLGTSGTQYAFSIWSDGGSQSHTITASSSVYMASFKTQYSLTTFVNSSGGGQVNPSGTTWHNQGENVPVSAQVNSGYTFSNWSGGLSGVSNPTSIIMNEPKVITANYSPNSCSLMVNVNPSGMGTVARDPDKSIYGYGDEVTLTARASEGYNFRNWSGDISGEMDPLTVIIKGNMTVTANFVPAGSFDVNPSWDLSATGRQRGPFDPSNQTYTLRNRSVKLVKWKVAKKPRWVTASPTNGSLTPGGVAQVIVSIGSGAKLLKPGSYSDTIVLCNVADPVDSVSKSVSLTIKPAVKTYTVKTNPDGLHFTVDGVDYTSPQTFEWEVGSYHILEALSPQPGSSGTQYVFSSWSNRKPQKQTLVAPPSGATYVANFRAQYVPTEIVNSTEEGTGVNNASGLTNLSSADLPILGALESPSKGKKVFGIKTIYGWVLDGEGISSVRFFIDGEYVCDIPYGSLRGDVKKAYPDYPNAEKSGFAMVWNYSYLSPGAHLVQIEVQNVKGEVLNLSSDIMVVKLPEEMIAEINPREWLIPGINFIVDGNTEKYDLRLEWSDQSQSFEIIDLYPQ